MRDNSEAVRVIGSFNSESKFIDAADRSRETSVLLDRGTRLFRGRTGRRRAGTHRSCAEGHRRQGRRTWSNGAVRSSCSSPMKRHTRKYAASPAASLPANRHVRHRPRRLRPQTDPRRDASAGERSASGVYRSATRSTASCSNPTVTRSAWATVFLHTIHQL